MDGDATCQLLAINEYTGQQATLTECRAACDCYLDDVRKNMLIDYTSAATDIPDLSAATISHGQL
jgi:hypothetical protein